MSGIQFHLAFPILDVEAAKRFYVDGLGCTLGRESSHAVTFGLHDHQLVAHVVEQPDTQKGI
ncbi:MAG TPA: glyoxalase, partial [Nitrospira sp.]|nr:glyoxalase [Nitrospira sp.]